MTEELKGFNELTYAVEDDELLDFSQALYELKGGRVVQRKGWNDKGMWVEMQTRTEQSKMTLSYLYINYPAGGVYPNGARVPWLASQTDLLSNDWRVLPENAGND